jgi:hypothetical protein
MLLYCTWQYTTLKRANEPLAVREGFFWFLETIHKAKWSLWLAFEISWLCFFSFWVDGLCGASLWLAIHKAKGQKKKIQIWMRKLVCDWVCFSFTSLPRGEKNSNHKVWGVFVWINYVCTYVICAYNVCTCIWYIYISIRVCIRMYVYEYMCQMNMCKQRVWREEIYDIYYIYIIFCFLHSFRVHNEGTRQDETTNTNAITIFVTCCCCSVHFFDCLLLFLWKLKTWTHALGFVYMWCCFFLIYIYCIYSIH